MEGSFPYSSFAANGRFPNFVCFVYFVVSNSICFFFLISWYKCDLTTPDKRLIRTRIKRNN
jgi:hypothetical protein